MDEARILRLEEYIRRVNAGENGFDLYHVFESDITHVTPMETMELMNRRLEKGEDVDAVLSNLEKFMHVFITAHKKYVWPQPDKNDFIGTLRQENDALIGMLEGLRPTILRREHQQDRDIYVSFLQALNPYNIHFQKKENLLFPALELKQKRFEGLKVMWSLHDVIRQQIKRCVALFATEELDTKAIDTHIGLLYFQLYGSIDKEEHILFPCAQELLSTNEKDALLEESFEYGFAYITPPVKPQTKKTILPAGSFNTPTGTMRTEELIAMFNVLPVDVTFVDADDKVRFFNNAKDRIFPRSPAILGRDVRNCHPAHSVHVVLDIIDSFKQNKENHAMFWIPMGPKFVVIQYFALRNENNEYLGTLEVSQEVSEIRSLQGQRRILSWEKPVE